MKNSELTPHQIELVVARLMGYHVRMPRNGNIPYVMIDDWNKEGTIVNGCRFEPLTDDSIASDVARGLHIQTKQTDDGKWSAGLLKPGMELSVWQGALSRAEAITMCALCSCYPTEVPDEMLEDNPL